MGMSQDEIDKLMDGSGGEKSVETGDLESLIGSLSVTFGDSFHNIVPILIGAGDCEITPGNVAGAPLGGILNAITGEAIYVSFVMSSLSESPMVLMVSHDIALRISRKMMGQEDSTEMTEALLSALNEAVNNVLGAYDTALSEEFGIRIEHSDVKFIDKDPVKEVPSTTGIPSDAAVHFAPLTVKCDGDEGTIGLLVSDDLLAELYGKHPKSLEESKPVENTPGTAAHTPAEQPSEQPAIPKISDRMKTSEPEVSEVHSAKFEELAPSKPTIESRGVELILDVPLDVAVELGRKQLSVKDIMGLVPGSLVELDKLAGEAVDLLVNGKLFARGEVVVIDENFGVRVSSIISPKERLEHIR
ncbi:MAG TPA: flagellar motor switch protein FliN [bacterium]